MKEIAKLDWNGVAKGVIGLGAVLVEIVGFEKLMGMGEKGRQMTTGSIELIALGAAMILMVKALKDLATLDWDSLSVGIAGMGGLLVELAAFEKMTSRTRSAISVGLALIEIGAAMQLFVIALKQLSEMNQDALNQGLIGFGVALGIVTAALALIPSSTSLISTGLAMIEVGAALLVIAQAIELLGKIPLDTLVTGLAAMGVALLEMGLALSLMSNTSVLNATGVLILVAALYVLVPVLKTLGELPLETLAVGLLAIAGVFAVFVAAGWLLMPVVAVLATFSTAMAVFSVSLIAIGAGLLTISLGLTSFVTTCNVVIDELIQILMRILTAIPEGIAALLHVLAKCIPAFVELLLSLVAAVLQVLEESAPNIVKTVLEVLLMILTELVGYVPQIIAQLVKFVVGVLDGLADGLPEIIKSLANLFKKLFDALVASFGEIDLGSIALAIVALTEMSVLMALVAVVAAEALVATLTLPIIGMNMSQFMENLQVFLDGIQNVDASTFEAVKYLAEAILLLTSSGIMNAVASWLSGESPLVAIGSELALFGPYLKSYSDSIKGIDPELIAKSGIAASVLSMFVDTIPKSGGIVAKVTGENSLTDFARELETFGPAFKSYYESVKGIDTEVIKASSMAAETITSFVKSIPKEGGLLNLITGDNSVVKFGTELVLFAPLFKKYSDVISGVKSGSVLTSSIAAKSLAAFVKELPETGGVLSWFTGEKNLVRFGVELEAFGPHLKNYSDSVVGVDPLVVNTSAYAANVMSEFVNTLPETGKALDWFTGTKNLVKFGVELEAFGPHLKNYSDAVVGVSPYVVQKSKQAADVMVALVDSLPETTALDWLTGEKNLNKFGESLKTFGPDFMEYYKAIADLKPDVVTASADAACSLAEFLNNLPETGGIGSWFTGNKDLSDFGSKLKTFGTGIKDFSDEITGMNAENVIAAGAAATSLTEFANNLPETGGLESLFSGSINIAEFINDLAPLGTGIALFDKAVADITPEKVESAANAAKSIAELFDNLPETGGAAWFFAGDKDLGQFATQLEDLGKGIKAFDEQVAEITPANVEAAANAAQSIAELADNLPETGGLQEIFSGKKDLSVFALGLSQLAPSFKTFGTAVDGLSDETLTKVELSTGILKLLLDAVRLIPEYGGWEGFVNGEQDIAKFSEGLPTLGENLQSFSDNITGINKENVEAAANCAKMLAEMVSYLPNTKAMGGVIDWFVGEKDLAGFSSSLAGEDGFGANIKAFSDSVDGISAENVTAAANAAKVLSETVSGLPTESNWTDFFTGKQMTLADFSEALKNFAPDFVEYVGQVKDIKEEDVSGSTNAAVALSELVKNLPESAALWGIFGGVQDLSDFGAKLVDFGKYFKTYSSFVKLVDPDVVASSAESAKAIVDIQSMLIELKGWNESGSGKSIDYFGTKMATFGEKFNSYYNNLKEISTVKLDAITTSLMMIITMITSLGGINLDNLKTFGENLGYMGKQGMTDFINSFDNSEETIKSAAARMLKNFISGVSENKQSVIDAYDQMFNEVFALLDSFDLTFNTKGQSLGAAAVLGISSKQDDFVKCVTDMINEALNKMKDEKHISEWYNVGMNIVQGMADGINNNTYIAKNAAESLAEAALKAAREELKEKSPSKAFYEIGEYSAIGFVNAFDDYEGIASNAGKGIANAAYSGLKGSIDKISRLIDDNIDTQPVITPVLDLSEIQNGSNQLFSMMSGITDLGLSESYSLGNNIMARVSREKIAEEEQMLSVLKDIDSSMKNISDNNGTTMENTFNITGNDPEEIADEISRILTRQVERRGASWA